MAVFMYLNKVLHLLQKERIDVIDRNENAQSANYTLLKINNNEKSVGKTGFNAFAV